MDQRTSTLGDYKDLLLQLARRADAAPDEDDERAIYTPLEVLFAAVKEGRNDAVRQGAYARHLVRHCVELAIHEEGLMADSRCVADFMVRKPASAEPWQPVALARQQMLTNSFSHLLIWIDNQWHLLSDHAIARFLAASTNPRQAVRERIAGRANREP